MRTVDEGEGGVDFEFDSAYRAKPSPEAALALLAQPLEQRRAWFER